MMDNKRIIQALEELNLIKTAETFKKEMGNMNINNDYRKDLFKQILNYLSHVTSDKEDKEAELKDKHKDNNTKFNNNNNTLEANKKIMSTLIQKVNTKMYPITTNNTNPINPIKSKLDKIENTKVYDNLMKKIQSLNRFTSNSTNIFQVEDTDNNYENEIVHENMRGDLPRFGSDDIQKNKNLNDNKAKNTNKTTSNPNMHIKENNSKIETEEDENKSLNENSLFPDIEEVMNINKIREQGNFKADDQFNNMVNSKNLQNMMRSENENMDNSSFFQNSIVMNNEDGEGEGGEDCRGDNNILNDSLDEYVDDEDPGFDLYECEVEYFRDTCKKLSSQYGFPSRAIRKKTKEDKEKEEKDKKEKEEKAEKEKKEKEAEKLDKENKEKCEVNKDIIKSVTIKDPEMANTTKNLGEKIYEVENQIKRKSLLGPDAIFMPSDDPYPLSV